MTPAPPTRGGSRVAYNAGAKALSVYIAVRRGRRDFRQAGGAVIRSGGGRRRMRRVLHSRQDAERVGGGRPRVLQHVRVVRKSPITGRYNGLFTEVMARGAHGIAPAGAGRRPTEQIDVLQRPIVPYGHTRLQRLKPTCSRVESWSDARAEAKAAARYAQRREAYANKGALSPCVPRCAPSLLLRAMIGPRRHSAPSRPERARAVRAMARRVML